MIDDDEAHIRAMTGPFYVPDVWDGSLPPGGFVCSMCGQPTESEPCSTHQRAKIAALNDAQWQGPTLEAWLKRISPWPIPWISR